MLGRGRGEGLLERVAYKRGGLSTERGGGVNRAFTVLLVIRSQESAGRSQGVTTWYKRISAHS